MKKSLLIGTLLFTTFSVFAKDTVNGIKTLNLTESEITYNENNVWDGIYSDENLVIDGLVFSHSAPYGDGYYEGFIVSKNSDNANHMTAAEWTANQWGCMAQGGVNSMNAEEGMWLDGIEGKPFLINYYSAYTKSTTDYGSSYFRFTDKKFTPFGIYVCNHPWGYWGCITGDGFASPLAEDGGYYKITFHGVNINEGTERTVDFFLAERKLSDINMDNIINSDDSYTLPKWEYCDLSTLGLVDLVYITMDSSDKGDFGMNTSTLVCLDELMYSEDDAAINHTQADSDIVYACNGNLYLSLVKPCYIKIYDIKGSEVMSQKVTDGIQMLSLQHLSSGIYIVEINDNHTKIII